MALVDTLPAVLVGFGYGDGIMSGWLAGPWTATLNENGENVSIMSSDGFVIVGCGCCGSPCTEKNHAQATIKLIAAAPEMAELLQEFAEYYYHVEGKPPQPGSMWAKAEAILAKIGAQS